MKKLVCLLLVCTLLAVSAAALAEPVKLVFWDMIWGSAGVYDKAGEALVAEFNASQDEIEVEYQAVPWDNYYQVFLTAITSGAGPDVATAGSQTPMQFASMGEIQPLDALLEKWEAENDPILDDFLPGFLETNLLDGHTIALPWNADTRVFTYRTDLFEEGRHYRTSYDVGRPARCAAQAEGNVPGYYPARDGRRLRRRAEHHDVVDRLQRCWTDYG